MLVAGSVAGCDPVAREAVTVHLPSENEATSTTNALSLIGRTLIKSSFQPIEIDAATKSNEPSLMACYGDPLEAHLGCFIYYRTGLVQIEFKQLGRYRLSPLGKRARDDLKKNLIETFGRGSVEP